MKKIVCLFLVISLVLACSGSAFAAPELATGSAFAIDERLLTSARLAAASASAPVGSSSDPYYVRPFTNGSATVYRYSWSTSNPNGSSSGINQSFTNFSDIVTHITSSIANSFLALGQRLHYDNDSIYGRLYDILQAIQTSSGDLGTFIPNFIPDSSYDFTSDAWSKYTKYGYLNNANQSISQPVFLLQLKGMLSNLGEISANNNQNILGFVKGAAYDGANYQSIIDPVSGNSISLYRRSLWVDFRYLMGQVMRGFYSLGGVDSSKSYTLTDYYNVPSSVSAVSLSDYLKQAGSNISASLGRLAYVLANDEDIEARDASSSVRQAYTNDFLKPSGSASASVSDFGILASGSSSLSNSFQSSYGASDALGSLSDQDDGRWDWFSQTTMDNLNSSSIRSYSMLKSNRGYTNFYEERYRELNHD